MQKLTDGMFRISDINEKMKETIIDLQARLMNDNPFFFRIPEQQEKDPERSIKRFLVKQLKPLAETVKKYIFPLGASPK